MVHKPFLHLLILYLGVSYILTSAAVPTSRSLKSTKEDPSFQYAQTLVAVDLREDDELVMERMNLEFTDYPGTGANNHHDPKTPGAA